MTLSLLLRRATFAVFIFALSLGAAQASTPTGNGSEGAEEFIRTLASKTLEVVQSGESKTQKEQKLTKLFESSVDVEWIGKFVLGIHWRSATDAQKKSYQAAYRSYITRTYVPKLMKYSDPKIVMKRSYKSDENEYTVETEVAPSDDVPLLVDYKLRPLSNGQFKVFDVIAEGISLAATQRADFSAVVAQDGLDGLIQKLQNKTLDAPQTKKAKKETSAAE